MKPKIPEHIRKELASEHACYVLITCDEPTEDGKMEVEMSYEGDPALAAYLLQGAQSFIEEMEEDEIEEEDYSCN